MTKEQWIAYYCDNAHKFEWLIKQYFDHKNYLRNLHELLSDNNVDEMLLIMNTIWFELPDSKFNMRVNPPGWLEFLYLMEESPEEE